MILKEVRSLNYLASNTPEVGVIFLRDTQPDGGRRGLATASHNEEIQTGPVDTPRSKSRLPDSCSRCLKSHYN